jgi:hypothetical protein
MLKGLGSSNPPLPANKSVHLAYILENGRKSVRNAAFFQLAAQQREPAHAGFSRFGEHSLCAKQKRFASAPERALGGVRPTIASPGDRQLNFDRSGLFSEKRHHFGATAARYLSPTPYCQPESF